MRVDYWILASVYVISAGLIFLIPRDRIRLAVAAFLFKQAITFLIGLVVVQAGLIEYPIREFASVNRTSFSYEYFAFPLMCAYFNVRYPNGRSIPIQLGYYAVYSIVLTVMEVIIETYTDLIEYIHWEWYVSLITIGLSFWITRMFCVWFFAKASD
ncbi:CBO0543 family protein [Paenibacillus kobensis]|uniref:CBO0543 family protein n=1 Tax=Paenibacillus kobensis TaxID=59841 RepID=UPI000FDC1F1B|nr:CBO0543 family protein [Paenibacillus kobensis]